MAVSACNPYACRYRTRFVATSGTTTTASGSLIVESLNFREYSEGEPIPNSVSYNMRGESLVAAPTTLTLRDRSTGAVIQTLSMGHVSTVSMVAGSAFDVAAADRESIFRLLADGRARVMLELQGGQTVTVDVAVTAREDWHRPSCD